MYEVCLACLRAAVGLFILLVSACTLPLQASPPPPRFGVNLAGGEGGKMPGSGDYPYGRYGYDYIFPNADEFAYFKSRGFNLVRLPVKWERVQNTLNGPLTPQDIGLIDTVIANAEAQGIQILIDLHNYNSYRILTASGWESHAVSSTGAVTYAHLQDFWGRIASRYVDNPGVFGYDLMNEPGGTLANWQAAAQAAVDTIRSIDTNHWIVVEGVSWAGAQSWTANNATLHIDDPADKLMYSAHSYWDRGYQNYVDNWKFDGLYTSYAQENGSPTMGVECLAPFVDWIVSHGYNGFVGEYGVPGTGSADSDLWNVALDNALAYLQTNGISGTYWTGGPWYGNYQLTCEPSPITGDDRPQMSVLSRYTDSALSPGFNPQADTILKADNIHALNQGSSWVGGIVPDANDIALWDATVGANTVLLGSDQSWGGLAVDAAHSWNVTISDGATLTLGTADITYVPNIALSLSCPIVLAADQTWTLTTGFFNVNEIETQGHQLTVTGNSNKKFKRQIPGGGPILVQSGSLTFDANADSGASESPITVKAGAGVVKISSGHVLLNPANQNMTTTINAPLDFGAVQGVIGGSYNRLVELKSAISGSAGLLFYQVASAAPNTQLSVRYSSGVTYTGDTIVLGRLEVNSNFLPSGMRTGDVYVHGYLKLNQAGYTGTINGLFGGGTVFYGNSGTSSLSIGDNNATSTFTGNISSNSNLSVNKVGAGTLTLDGATTHTKGTTVQGGTLVLNGSALSPFTVYSGATLRGKGMIDKSGTAITIQSGGTLAPGDADGIGTMTVLQGSIAPSAGSNLEITIGKGGCSFLDVAGDITGNATVSVTVKGEGPGKWLVAQASSITADFSSATPDVKLTLEADGTQLWAERLNPVSLLIMK